MTRRCLDCTTLIKRGSRCPSCEAQRPQRTRRTSLDRIRIIVRDRGCVLRLNPGHHCRAPLEVDHIISRADWRGDPAAWDSDANKQTLCWNAHRAKTGART